MRWVRNLFRRARVERELDDELQAYLELLTAEKIDGGMSPERARRAALVEVGGTEQVKENVRDVWSGAWLQDIARDLRYAARALARTPGFTSIAVVTLGLGVGATTAIASLMYGLYRAPLPFPEAHRLVQVYQSHAGMDGYFELSYPDYLYFRDHARSFSSLAAYYMAPLHLVYDNQPAAITGSVVTPSYFSVLRVYPALGRFFLESEGQVPGRDHVVVLGHRLWRTRFAGDSAVVGRGVRINGVPFTIIGVAPPELKGVGFGYEENALWIPSSMFRVGYKYCDGYSPACRIVTILGRLARSATLASTQVELSTLAAQEASANPELNEGRGAIVLPARGAAPGRYVGHGRVVTLLAAAVALVLAIVCANLAGLLLARNLARTREIALRLSLGAGRGRIVRELLTEALVLGFLGGGLGLGVALLGNEVIRRFFLYDYAGRIAYFHMGLDPAVLGVALGVTLLAVLAFGLVPAFRAGATDLLTAIKVETQSGLGRSRLRDALVVLQVALALVLVVDATLLIRSLRHVYQGENFDPGHVLLLRLRPTLVGYDVVRARAFQAEALRRLEATPGVLSASPAVFHGNQGNNLVTAWLPGDVPADPTRAPEFPSNRVGPRFFRTLGVRPLAGREFDEHDGVGAPAVVIVNQALVRRFWPAGGGVGRRLVVAGVPSEVIGVVPDLEYRMAGQAPRPFVYQSYWQGDPTSSWAAESRTHVLVSGDPRAMLPVIRRVIAAVDPEVPVSEDQPLVDRLGYEFQPVRVAQTAMVCFGGLALFLSAFGLYGVLAFRVTQRTREIGIRMALGAGRGAVAWLVLRRGAVLAAAGALVGLAAALGSSRLLESLLYGVSGIDPLALAGAPVLLIGVALAASYLPARRATRLDPLRALRQD